MNKTKIITVQDHKLSITITKEKDGSFIATCPMWMDCYAQGETIEEAISEVTSVASSLMEVYQEENMKTVGESSELFAN